jgi:predicted protein tyrosine phosphatase
MSNMKIAHNLYVGDIGACLLARGQDDEARPAIVHMDDLCSAEPGPLDLVTPITDDDDGAAVLPGMMGEISSFIDKHREERPVLVHCTAGVSRSPTVLLLYLIRKGEMTEQEFRAIYPAYNPLNAFQVLVMEAEDRALAKERENSPDDT